MMKEGEEYLYALHQFDAENDDEVSFMAGERIIVREKDDAYNDGWYQGTNEKGETGLFPFSYTTHDKELALGAKLLQAGGAGAGLVSGNSTPIQQDGFSSAQATSLSNLNGKGSNKGGVMDSTMADIDGALAGLRTRGGGGGGGDDTDSAEGVGNPRASIHSERTADLNEDDDENSEENGTNQQYQSASATRSALAENAKKNLNSQSEKEKLEDQKRREQAQRLFQEEEEKQRMLLLKKEEERQIKLREGTLNASNQAPKIAPEIARDVEMSDDSESEDEDQGIQSNRNFIGDDTVPITHSPLFGDSSSKQVDSNDLTSKALETSNEAPISGRTLSPIPSASNHASNTQDTTPAIPSQRSSYPAPEATTTNGRSSVTRAFDERSIDSSRGRGSMADSISGGNNGTGTAATSVAALPQGGSSPAPSVRGNAPGGDPHDWSVEQVVEWGRSKGWDENSVVSKFAEHEITGDVLMEMDVNILKEIDIIAFGKRFQVSQAIKELKTPSAPIASPAIYNRESPTPATPVSQTGSRAAPGSSDPPNFGGQQSQTASSPYGLYPPTAAPASAPLTSSTSSGPSFGQLGSNFSGPQSLRHQSSESDLHKPAFDPSNRQTHMSDGSRLPESPASASFPDQFGGGRTSSGATVPGGLNSPSEILSDDGSGSKSRLSGSRRNGPSDEDFVPPLSAGSSPRRRENSGTGRSVGSGERSSFFGIGPRARKQPPNTSLTTGGGGSTTDDSNHRGTLSRLRDGFGNRSSRQSQQPSNQELREKISLPTSGPQYNSMGDTARRNRSSGGAPTTGAGFGHGRQTSVGSMAGGGVAGNDWSSSGAAAAGVPAPASNLEPRSPGGASSQEGPVMARIRPVDLEGWMRKKGERYNTWKPRYLALKGSDLVLLRDPTAEKIKGYVSMKGYKVIADENTNPGKYGFKILHETEKPHYFSSDDPILVREWMKALMKSTIGRDHSFPVISSYNNATISLKQAQAMNPPPRPPSPTSRARAQRARAREDPSKLTAKDAAVLMGLSNPGAKGNGAMSQLPSSPNPSSTTINSTSTSAFKPSTISSPNSSFQKNSYRLSNSQSNSKIRSPTLTKTTSNNNDSNSSSYPFFNFGSPKRPSSSSGLFNNHEGKSTTSSSKHERNLSLAAESEASFNDEVDFDRVRSRPPPRFNRFGEKMK